METWSCLLGLLVCTPVVVIGTASQKPPAITGVGVNSSAEIQCSTTTCPRLTGLSLKGRFHGNREVVHLSLLNGAVQRQTEHENYRGRVGVVQSRNPEHRDGCSITLRLSRLAVKEDTDQYICHWDHSTGSDHSDGTILIVRGPWQAEAHSCRSHTENNLHVDSFTVVVLSVTSFTVMLFIFVGALIWRCRRG